MHCALVLYNVLILEAGIAHSESLLEPQKRTTVQCFLVRIVSGSQFSQETHITDGNRSVPTIGGR